MKSCIKIVFLATFILLVASCAKDENTPINNNQLTESDLAPLEVSDSFFVYDAVGFSGFAVNENGIVYEGIESFALAPNGNLIIAGRHGAGGYFAELDTSTRELNKPKHMDVGVVSNMAADERGVFFCNSGGQHDVRFSGIGYTFLGDDGGVIAIDPDGIGVRPHKSIAYTRGLCWYLFRDGNRLKLMWIKVADFVDEPQEIEMLSSWAGAIDDSFGGRFILNRTSVSNEEFALSMLSRDSAHDVFLVSSSETIAYNIKEKGAFYPLNDVPFVQEYIDACFPFVADAAIDDDGYIWMIPVNISVDFIMYHTENAAEAGLDIASAETPLDILNFVMEANNAGAENYGIHISDFISNCLYKYMRENDTFDTSEFRALAEKMREIANLDDFEYSRNGTASIDNSVTESDMLFSHMVTPGIFSFFFQATIQFADNVGKFDVIPITGTSGSPSASAEFLCVNPHSDNLDATLAFISSVAQHQLGIENSFILSDTNTYTNSQFVQRLYALYEGSTIDFSMPYEIYRYAFMDYLIGMMSLDEMIAESDRLINMYRYE